MFLPGGHKAMHVLLFQPLNMKTQWHKKGSSLQELNKFKKFLSIEDVMIMVMLEYLKYRKVKTRISLFSLQKYQVKGKAICGMAVGIFISGQTSTR